MEELLCFDPDQLEPNCRKHSHASVRKELLLKTNVNELEKSVNWHGLQLLVLDIDWLHKIHWVQKLRLAQNGFRSLPNEMDIYLKLVSCMYLAQWVPCGF